MTEVAKILKKLSALKESEIDNLFKYTIFEENQVLTHEDLNTIASYFNYQTRLTKVNLLGVGIISGLRVSWENDKVKVTEGIGLTTDGDLLFYSTPMSFNRFKVYGNSYPIPIPIYTPFYVDGDPSKDMIPVYELVGDKVQDNQATELSQFNTTTGKLLTNMVALLYLESYINKPDMCSGTDCDNRGKDYLNKLKVLLLEKPSVKALNKKLVEALESSNKNLHPREPSPTPLNKIVVLRLSLMLSSPSYSSPSYPIELTELKGIYISSCNQIHQNLIVELPKLYARASAILVDLVDLFPSDPSGGWITILNNFNAIFNNPNLTNDPTKYTSFQYYYDFLKDVAETYNHFVELFFELFFEDSTWLCPDIDSFPKHLLLGNLIPSSDLQENRTIFYPSPLLSQSAKTINHLKFLFQKLHTLINTFQASLPINLAIYITPSQFEDQPLEERAIPFYYEVNTTNPIQKNWNYRLHQWGMDAYNYSYNASAYGASGGAVDPFGCQIGRFPFFRIEGHLGKNVYNAVVDIKQWILYKNIPFAVQTVRLGTGSTGNELPLFKDFIAEHPGLEHFAGVLRGGTFVLLVDENNETVIADFMLPYLPQSSLLKRIQAMERKLFSPMFARTTREFWPPLAQAGVKVTLFGENFNVTPPKVFFGEIPAEVVSATDSQIVVTVPKEMKPGDINIQVRNEFGSATSSKTFRVPRPGPIPTISWLTPKVGRPDDSVRVFLGQQHEVTEEYKAGLSLWFDKTHIPLDSYNIEGFGGGGVGVFWYTYAIINVPDIPAGEVSVSIQNNYGISLDLTTFTVLADSTYGYGIGSGIGIGNL